MTVNHNLLPRVAALGVSSVLDTYLVNACHGTGRFRYHRTFPHLLRTNLICLNDQIAEVVHIADNYNRSSFKNIIVRLALIDPNVVFTV